MNNRRADSETSKVWEVNPGEPALMSTEIPENNIVVEKPVGAQADAGEVEAQREYQATGCVSWSYFQRTLTSAFANTTSVEDSVRASIDAASKDVPTRME